MIYSTHDNYSELLEQARDMDCREIIGREVPLKKYGNHLIGHCPFHNEKTPSFHVWTKNFHCFGCEAHGDSLEFITRLKQFDHIYQAIEYLTGCQVNKKPGNSHKPIELITWEEGQQKMREVDRILFDCLVKAGFDNPPKMGGYLKNQADKNAKKFKKILETVCD